MRVFMVDRFSTIFTAPISDKASFLRSLWSMKLLIGKIWTLKSLHSHWYSLFLKLRNQQWFPISYCRNLKADWNVAATFLRLSASLAHEDFRVGFDFEKRSGFIIFDWWFSFKRFFKAYKISWGNWHLHGFLRSFMRDFL